MNRHKPARKPIRTDSSSRVSSSDEPSIDMGYEELDDLDQRYEERQWQSPHLNEESDVATTDDDLSLWGKPNQGKSIRKNSYATSSALWTPITPKASNSRAPVARLPSATETATTASKTTTQSTSSNCSGSPVLNPTNNNNFIGDSKSTHSTSSKQEDVDENIGTSRVVRSLIGLALQMTSQEWSHLGVPSSHKDGRDGSACATAGGSASGTGDAEFNDIVDRLTALLLVRLLGVASPPRTFPDFSTSSICRTVLVQPDCWPASVSRKVLEELQTYVTQIVRWYHPYVPYHNVDHALHVTLSINKLLDLMLGKHFGQEVVPPTFGLRYQPLALLSLVWAAFIHDVDHQGVPNRQLATEETDHPLAILYNDQSIAENQSLFLAFDELLHATTGTDEQPRYETLRKVMCPTRKDYLIFRKNIINLVLPTDIASPEKTQLSKSKFKEANFEGADAGAASSRRNVAGATSGGSRRSLVGENSGGSRRSLTGLGSSQRRLSTGSVARRKSADGSVANRRMSGGALPDPPSMQQTFSTPSRGNSFPGNPSSPQNHGLQNASQMLQRVSCHTTSEESDSFSSDRDSTVSYGDSPATEITSTTYEGSQDPNSNPNSLHSVRKGGRRNRSQNFTHPVASDGVQITVKTASARSLDVLPDEDEKSEESTKHSADLDGMNDRTEQGAVTKFQNLKNLGNDGLVDRDDESTISSTVINTTKLSDMKLASIEDNGDEGKAFGSIPSVNSSPAPLRKSLVAESDIPTIKSIVSPPESPTKSNLDKFPAIPQRRPTGTHPLRASLHDRKLVTTASAETFTTRQTSGPSSGEMPAPAQPQLSPANLSSMKSERSASLPGSGTGDKIPRRPRRVSLSSTDDPRKLAAPDTRIAEGGVTRNAVGDPTLIGDSPRSDKIPSVPKRRLTAVVTSDTEESSNALSPMANAGPLSGLAAIPQDGRPSIVRSLGSRSVSARFQTQRLPSFSRGLVRRSTWENNAFYKKTVLKKKKLGIRRSMDLSGEMLQQYSTSSKSELSLNDDDMDDEFKASVVLETLIFAADVAGNLQSFNNMVKWSNKLYMELRRAHVAGRGPDVSQSWYRNQIGFLEFYVLPLAKRMDETGVFGKLIGPSFARQVEANRDRWLADGQRITDDVIEEGKRLFPDGTLIPPEECIFVDPRIERAAKSCSPQAGSSEVERLSRDMASSHGSGSKISSAQSREQELLNAQEKLNVIIENHQKEISKIASINQTKVGFLEHRLEEMTKALVRARQTISKLQSERDEAFQSTASLTEIGDVVGLREKLLSLEKENRNFRMELEETQEKLEYQRTLATLGERGTPVSRFGYGKEAGPVSGATKVFERKLGTGTTDAQEIRSMLAESRKSTSDGAEQDINSTPSSAVMADYWLALPRSTRKTIKHQKNTANVQKEGHPRSAQSSPQGFWYLI